MRHVLIAAAVLALSACSPEGEPAAAAPAPASAVDPAAEAFVRGLYTVEQGGTSTGAEDEGDAGPMFSARTQALLDEDVAVTPEGYVGYEEIHLCDCSDDGGMVLDSVTMTPRGPDRMDATVSMTWTMAQPPETKRQTLNLIKEKGHWVIDDIERDLSDALPHRTLVAGLTEHIAETRAWVAKQKGA
jgi:hypothetical protein